MLPKLENNAVIQNTLDVLDQKTKLQCFGLWSCKSLLRWSLRASGNTGEENCENTCKAASFFSQSMSKL